MKNFLVSVTLFFITSNLVGQPVISSNEFLVEPKVDRRVELLSIVFRLAGNNEYNTNFFKRYVSDIQEHFEPYKDHSLIHFTKKLSSENSIGYDAVMAMAIQLEMPPVLDPKVSFELRLPEQRWTIKDASKFVSLLKDFYKEARCEDFFNDHNQLYAESERRFKGLIKKVDFNWYKSYYGELPHAKFHLVIGLGNGGGNYGPKVIYPDKTEELYAIMGTWLMDSSEMPVYDERVLPVIIHEYSHSFINPIIDEYASKLEASGKKIFEPVREQMKKMAYANWKTMMYESLVRASVIMYMKQHEKDGVKAQAMINNEQKNGFLWIGDMIRLLDSYERNRDQFATLRSFMPEIILLYNQLALKN